MLSWGIRMTITVIVPLFYGILTGRSAEMTWVIVTAESICWVELKGSFAQRTRILLGGAFLALLFGFAGSISSTSLWLSLLLMMIVVFIACLFKNLGERGSGLSLSVYVMFIIANAYPVNGFDETIHRSACIVAGGAWALVVGVVASLFMSEQTPYRRSIAFIWKSTAALAAVIDMGWDGKGPRSGIRDIFLKQKEVHSAIENSLQLYEKRAYHTDHESVHAEQMAQLRKSAFLTSINIMAMAEELESVNLKALTSAQRLSVHAILKSIEVICERLTIYTVSSKTEEEMLLRSRIIRLQNMAALLREGQADIAPSELRAVLRIVHITERIIKLIENAMTLIASVSTDRKVYRSYSLMKTLLILHHKHWFVSIRRLANINTHSFRYALRTAIVGTLALFVSRWFAIPHGYWLPFTVMIVIQPYFGATIQKAIDRVLGTILGGIFGGLLLLLPAQYHLKEVLIIISPMLMVYFLRKHYSIATFFITVFLVSLMEIEASLDGSVILVRALCTIGGAALAVVGEFALLPSWDKKWLPRHIGDAVKANYDYFLFTFYPEANAPYPWTHYRRLAESANSNAFDSFNRYLQEPTGKEKLYSLFYQMISHCIRITRELNNFHIGEEGPGLVNDRPLAEQQGTILQCTTLFRQVTGSVQAFGIAPESGTYTAKELTNPLNAVLNEMQSLYLDKISLELKAFVRDMDKWPVKEDPVA